MKPRFWTVLLAALLMPGLALAQQEFPPPSGKGRVVVMLAGQSGSAHYRDIAGRVAALGYDVVLYDSQGLENTKGKALRDAIVRARHMPHALPGKVGLIGFSLGGIYVLAYGGMWSDVVAVAIAWYPMTSPIKDVAGWAGRLRVPVVMFAGTQDTYKDCCTIGKAQQLEKAARARGAAFVLTTYNAPHDFVLGGAGYKPQAFDDAFKRTDAALKQYLAN